jgi:hypothetical protein
LSGHFHVGAARFERACENKIIPVGFFGVDIDNGFRRKFDRLFVPHLGRADIHIETGTILQLFARVHLIPEGSLCAGSKSACANKEYCQKLHINLQMIE